MVVVIDTNILLQCLARKNRLRPIWDAFLAEQYIITFSVSIKYEYHEKLVEKTSVAYAETIIAILDRAANVSRVNTYFHWNIIRTDPDNNKFYDAAVAANADYLVTNDAHFNEAKRVLFPKVKIISADEFLEIIRTV